MQKTPKDWNFYPRGTIVMIRNRKQYHGNIEGKTRPAVIISNDVGNYFSPTLIVCYLTTKIKRLDLTPHVVLKYWYNMKKSMVMTEQIATVNKQDIIRVMGHLHPEDLMYVDKALQGSLALKGG